MLLKLKENETEEMVGMDVAEPDSPCCSVSSSLPTSLLTISKTTEVKHAKASPVKLEVHLFVVSGAEGGRDDKKEFNSEVHAPAHDKLCASTS